MSTSTPSPRRVMSASSKSNRNAAIPMGTSSKTVSTMSTVSSVPLQTLNPNSTAAPSENFLSTTAKSVADVNGSTSAAVPALNLTPWKDAPRTVRTPKSKSKMSASKIPLRATCEDVFDDEAHPNVHISPSAGTKTIPKPKMTVEAMYRDMPVGDIHMNPKSPKSPKTQQSPKMKMPVEQRGVAKKKKCKKKKSKDVPPAKIRSPTLEEKQARLMETFKLYDNPFQKQYEKIKEMQFAAPQTGTKAEQDAKLVADVKMYQQLDPNNVPANNFIDSFEKLVDRSHARMEANRDTPITESLQKQSAIKVDVDGAAVGRAQDFWAEPNEILGDAGKNLNNTFKAALDRAAGAKINTTVFGVEADKGLKRPVLQTGESETILKLEDKVADLIIDPEKDAIAAKEAHLIKSRVVDIMVLAVETSQNSEELSATMHELFPRLTIHACWVTDSIISKIANHPRLLINYGSYGTTIISSVNYIIDKVYPMFSTCRISDDEKALAWCEFITSSVKLWKFTDQQLKQLKPKYTKATGLHMMNGLVLESLQGFKKRQQGISGQFDIKVLTNASIWLVEELCWTAGELRVVVSLAEKALPSKKILFETLDSENGWKLLGHPGRDAFIKGLDLDFGEIRTLLEAMKENRAAMEACSRAMKTVASKIPETPLYSLAEPTFSRPGGKDNTQLSDYGHTISEVIEKMRSIIDNICTPWAIDLEEQFDAQNDFIYCGVALWNLVEMRLTHEERTMQKGLVLMAQNIWHALITEAVPREEKISIIGINTKWFIQEWMNAGGDIKLVKEEALKSMPKQHISFNPYADRERGRPGQPSGSSKAPAPAQPVKTEVQKATPKTFSAQLPVSTYRAMKNKHKISPPPTYSQTPTSMPQGGVFEPTDETLSLLLGYGHDIPQAISHMETILKNLSDIDPATLQYKIISDDCVECSCALWYHIQQANIPVQSEKKVKTGLEMLCFAILSSLNDRSMSHFVRLQLYIKCSVWFMLQWKETGGDFEKVGEEAMKELPTGTEDLRLFPRFSISYSLVSGLAAAVIGDGSTTIMAPKVSEPEAVSGAGSSTATSTHKVVLSKNLAEAKFEIPTAMKHVEAGDGENFDVSHESMEYIKPSALTTSGSSLKPVPEPKIVQVNAGSDSAHSKQAGSTPASSILNTPATPAEKSSPVPNNNTSQDQTNTHEQTTTDHNPDNMPNNTAPPTPPMTSGELGAAHASPVSDLEIISDTLMVLSQSLHQITTALYGTNASQTDSNTTDFKTELSAGARKTGLLIITDHLGKWLRDAQSEIAAVDGKVRDLDSAIDGLRRDNRELKMMVVEKVRRQGEEDNMLEVLLEEVRGLKGEVERLAVGREKDGEDEKERECANAVWLERARELQGVVERAREVGELREVLWPQGDGGFGLGLGVGGDFDRARAEGTGEAETGKGGRRELYVKIGNQAGRGQGGGGFCGVM
ncbi:hypothetical protein IFR05_002599 [Cadophora sp. M221]|nr:hypothetical protein IFR05_002599 [Cadophora sp. M221]